MNSPPLFPANSVAILYESLEAQRATGIAFDLRVKANEDELRIKKDRYRLLYAQIERRLEMELINQQACDATIEQLEYVAVIIRERQATLVSDGYQVVAFNNGDLYEGNWRSSRMHGTGCLMRKAANDIYEGEWFLGTRHGVGRCHTPNFNTFYSGKWQDGKWHGRGELLEPEGVYVGDFVDGRLQGFGEYVYNDGHVYRGEWVNGLYNGTGTYLCSKGPKYEGQWVGGLEHGRGTMTYFNGDVYIGEWQHGRRHGMGTYSSPLLRYEGNWRYGAVHGHGVCKYVDGSVYEGEWKNGMYHGEGDFFDKTHGESYHGMFCNGKRSGHGVYRSEEVEYTGLWLDDKKHGMGEIKIRGGGSYYGTWCDDVLHGNGIYECNEEKVQVKFDCGKCVRTSPRGQYQKVDVRLLCLSGGVE